MLKRISPIRLMKLLRWWPPYLASGIKVRSLNENFTKLTVEMKQTFYNTNYVGCHYGGSLYSICDPFYMFMLLQHLSKDHIVWDKAAHIEFIAPGKGTVHADFEISLDQIEDFKNQTLEQFKIEPKFYCNVLDEKGDLVAKVEKTLYIRRKDAKERFSEKITLL